MKKEAKICLPTYKCVYSFIFVVLLSLIYGIVFVEEIGGALEGPIALLAAVFCADTYLMEVQSKRSEVFGLYPLKKRVKVMYRRLGIQIAYLSGISAVGYGLFYWQRPIKLVETHSSSVLFGMFFFAMFVTIFLWSCLSVVICTLCRNIWVGLGLVMVIWIVLVSKEVRERMGVWSPFSFSSGKLEEIMDMSWIVGKGIAVLLIIILVLGIPVIIKKRG